MPKIRKPSVLTGLTAAQAMRRQVVGQTAATPIAQGIRALVKYKSNALLIRDEAGAPQGVVSKTDLMGAYYAGLPTPTPLGDIMVGPPRFCFPDDDLESCLSVMQQYGIHQLYVLGADIHAAVGVVDYGDILGLLYRYCRTCTQSRHASRLAQEDQAAERLRVREVMTRKVETCPAQTPLTEIIEILSARGFGALLIQDGADAPQGVISKSDLMGAYQHGVDPAASAQSIMGRPLVTCEAEALLADAIQQMLVRDVQRLFVHHPAPDTIVGVLSLSNAARFRSGTCRACRSSRLMDP